MGRKLLRLSATLLSPGASGTDAHHPSTAPLYAHHLDALLAFGRGARGGVHGPPARRRRGPQVPRGAQGPARPRRLHPPRPAPRRAPPPPASGRNPLALAAFPLGRSFAAASWVRFFARLLEVLLLLPDASCDAEYLTALPNPHLISELAAFASVAWAPARRSRSPRSAGARPRTPLPPPPRAARRRQLPWASSSCGSRRHSSPRGPPARTRTTRRRPRCTRTTWTRSSPSAAALEEAFTDRLRAAVVALKCLVALRVLLARGAFILRDQLLVALLRHRPPAATRSRSPPSRWAAPSPRPPGSARRLRLRRLGPRAPLPLAPTAAWGALKYFVPALEWVPHYGLDKFKFDLLSGLTITSLASPRRRASSRRSTNLLLHPKRRDSGDGGSRSDGVAVRDWMVLQMQSLKLCSNLYRSARGCTLDDNLPSLILHPKRRDIGDDGSRPDGVAVSCGLGERLGYKGIKVALPRETTTGKCFLQHYIESILSLQEASCKMEGECHTKIPFAIMTSDDTNALTIKLLESNSYFGMEPSQVKIIKQKKVACLADNDARLALDPNDKYKIQTKPHGHGDVHSLLYSSGLLEQWKSTRQRWVLFFQDTNRFLFNAIPSALGVSATKGYNVNSLAVPRKAKEAIGGITKLTHVDGRTMVINVEYNQLDPLLRATGHPDGDANCETGYFPYPGNINQIWLPLNDVCTTGGSGESDGLQWLLSFSMASCSFKETQLRRLARPLRNRSSQPPSRTAAPSARSPPPTRAARAARLTCKRSTGPSSSSSPSLGTWMHVGRPAAGERGCACLMILTRLGSGIGQIGLRS
ncbi:hypothetical protein ZWY2020_030616 [Hordeum vulgare]|nr:hypothetical protein ZWY2020_030616 [Hordeum vulgare]